MLLLYIIITVERRLSELVKTRGGSDNQTTCNTRIRKIHHLGFSNMQYCITKIHHLQYTDIVIYCILLVLAV